MSTIRCSYACTSGPCAPGPTSPPGTGGSEAHGGWMIVVGGGVVGVVAGAVVVVVGAAVVLVGWARVEVGSSRRAEPAAAMPDTRTAAITNETSTGGRNACLSGDSCRCSEERIVLGRMRHLVTMHLHRRAAGRQSSPKVDRTV